MGEVCYLIALCVALLAVVGTLVARARGQKTALDDIDKGINAAGNAAANLAERSGRAVSKRIKERQEIKGLERELRKRRLKHELDKLDDESDGKPSST